MGREIDYEKVRQDLIALGNKDIPRSSLLEAIGKLTREQVKFTTGLALDSGHTTVQYPPADSFENRSFISPQHVFLDRDNMLQKARLAVTAEGAEFIKSYPRILRDIEKGLYVLSNSFDYSSNEPLQEVPLGSKRRIKFWKKGGQSNIYQLEVQGQPYVVKTHAPQQGFSDPSQPFINEMMQMQELQKQFGDSFKQHGLELPTCLFASGQMACREFVAGERPREQEVNKHFPPDLRSKIEKFISEKKKSKDPLWKNIEMDIYFDGHSLKCSNFILKKDEKMVWIDPFFYAQPGLIHRLVRALS